MFGEIGVSSQSERGHANLPPRASREALPTLAEFGGMQNLHYSLLSTDLPYLVRNIHV